MWSKILPRLKMNLVGEENIWGAAKDCVAKKNTPKEKLSMDFLTFCFWWDSHLVTAMSKGYGSTANSWKDIATTDQLIRRANANWMIRKKLICVIRSFDQKMWPEFPGRCLAASPPARLLFYCCPSHTQPPDHTFGWRWANRVDLTVCQSPQIKFPW